MTAPVALALDGRTLDGGLYLRIDHWAQHLPAPLRHAVTLYSTLGLLLLAALMALAWWRARRADSRTVARALVAPLTVVVAFAADLVLKSALREPRPCRVLDAGRTLEACPAAGDWSMPSNHTVIVFAGAAALWLVDRRLGALALLSAAAMGAERVLVGVHYPHDVLLGALLGTAAGYGLTRLAGRGAPLVERAREGRLRRWLTA
ncbi:undecaprenyl-diphosphatase [Kitasatospora sp. SolWspMP-SS2h]|uniref:phosphatase PAP2 family protein n=1 Tax=Kitasatospora sp. SolWspMP-SS2h TaxID=1305729 RepID=UPI000DB90FB9|nr:phosphatase PAP2 family protein [Kitasatospora sp. SolWspMP-SS2h]RAJ36779.1 undecaprenyl-diphosphatase [Kitasatospora sp. SolWspMP-SS2h]